MSLKSGGDATVTGNMITDGRGKGVFIHDKGRGIFDGNDIARNVGTGVTVASGGDPVLRRNRVIQNGSHGFCVDGAAGLMEENVVEANSGDGFHVKNGGTPEVRGNEVCKSDGHGVHVCREAQGCYIGNQVGWPSRTAAPSQSSGMTQFGAPP